MNSVQLVGRLTREVDIKYTDGGNTVVRIGIACDRRFKKDGQPTADFINCVAFGKTAEFIEKYFNKGQRIGLTGHIQTGSYEDKDGNKRTSFDVVVDSVEFVDSKSSTNADVPSPASADDGFVEIPDGIDEALPFN